MARVAIAASLIDSSGGFPTTAPHAAPVAADVANKQKTPFTGREIIVAYNPSGTPYNVTVESIAYKGRTGDLVVSVPAGEHAYIGPFSLEGGWMQTAVTAEVPGDAGSLYFKAANAAVLFDVIRMAY